MISASLLWALHSHSRRAAAYRHVGSVSGRRYSRPKANWRAGAPYRLKDSGPHTEVFAWGTPLSYRLSASAQQPGRSEPEPHE
jgi:hypothetical protein